MHRYARLMLVRIARWPISRSLRYPRTLAACLLGLWTLLLTGGAHAAADNIEIRAPYLAPVSGVYVLTAELLLATPQRVEQSVREGATLNLELQVRISRSRAWWRDRQLVQLQQHYTLLYHGVSERYLVRNVNSGAQTSYANFEQAIESLRQVTGLPVVDQNLVAPDARNEASMRAVMEVRSIPRALGLLLFWVDNFSLESDWYTWPMNP